MRRILRMTAIVLTALVVICAVASVGVVSPRTVRVVGADGGPVDAWAAYYYQGNRFSFVDAVDYSLPGGIARTDTDGNLRLPSAVYLRFPLDGRLQHRIELLYAPALHATARYPLAADPLPRIFARSDDGGTVRLADQTGDPEMFERSLGSLFSLVRYDLMGGSGRKFVASAETVEALALQVVGEYRALIELHAGTPRTVPTMGMDHLRYQPDAEREAILARIHEGIAREPLWGPYVERVWGRRIADLERMIGG